MLVTRFTKLVGCSVPLQLAGMGGVWTPELVRAVASAGGLGMIGGIMVPAPVLAATLNGFDEGTRRRVGVNFLMPFLDRPCVELAASKAGVVEFFFGDPDPELVGVAHAGGALASWQVGSAEEARRAEAAGCDFIVAQGMEAGGHLRGRLALLPLLDEVLSCVHAPVVAAGGIGTGRAFAAVLAAGASAARVGTRFVAAIESNAHPAYLQALIDAGPEDAVYTETFSVMWPAPHRVLRSCIAAAEAFDGEVVAQIQTPDGPLPAPRFAPPAPTKATVGAVEAMAMYAGQSVGAVRSALPAAQIVRELVEEAEAFLRAAIPD